MSVTAPRGFCASGLACGIKGTGALDLAMVATDDAGAVPAAGVFTSNLAAAAPVALSRSHLASTSGRAAAVVVSSGNANAATGERGMADARRICELTARALGTSADEVLLCQTGLIGIALPMQRIEPGLAKLVEGRAEGREAAGLAAEAMMTTDTVRKEVTVERSGVVVGGMAKGAAMLAPNMATMLAVLTTDAQCEPAELALALGDAVADTFNQMTVDGCTSTNDSVMVMASGRSGVTPSRRDLVTALAEACDQLATMMAADAEGATKLATIEVTGALTHEDARRAARKVAESMLVKCSLNGGDPYWGRVVSELGSSGGAFELERVEVSYGGICVCRGGIAAEHDTDALAAHMRQRSIEISCDLGLGDHCARVTTCDLGYGYIDENRTTS